jgi:hypothetical protein
MDYEWVGATGSTQDSLHALAMHIEQGPRPHGALLLATSGRAAPKDHIVVLMSEMPERPRYTVVSWGFTSGYPGEGPTGTSKAVLLLKSADVDIHPRDVSRRMFDRIESGRATYADLEAIRQMPRGRFMPIQLVQDDHQESIMRKTAWREWTSPAISRGLLSPLVFDLADAFQKDPREAIVAGFRRLESELRQRLTTLDIETTGKAGVELANLAFGVRGALGWDPARLSSSEQEGRRELLVGAFKALRNPRVHLEDFEPEPWQDLQDLYLLSRLSDWVSNAVPRTSRPQGH